MCIIYLFYLLVSYTYKSYTCIIYPLRPALCVRVFRFLNAEPPDCRLGHLAVAEGFLTGGAVGGDVCTPGVGVTGTSPTYSLSKCLSVFPGHDVVKNGVHRGTEEVEHTWQNKTSACSFEVF